MAVRPASLATALLASMSAGSFSNLKELYILGSISCKLCDVMQNVTPFEFLINTVNPEILAVI